MTTGLRRETAGADGRGFTFRGDWLEDTRYFAGDVIASAGSAYINR